MTENLKKCTPCAEGRRGTSLWGATDFSYTYELLPINAIIQVVYHVLRAKRITSDGKEKKKTEKNIENPHGRSILKDRYVHSKRLGD